jgi:hypothetical protein
MEEGRRLPGWILPTVAVVVVIALVAVGLSREPAELDPDSPEGAVQAYIQALSAGDFDEAATYWATDGCLPPSNVPTAGAPDVSASLVSVDDNDRQATVVVRLTENSTDPLSGLYEYEEWFMLVNEDGAWKISQPSWPYYDQMCEETA